MGLSEFKDSLGYRRQKKRGGGGGDGSSCCGADLSLSLAVIGLFPAVSLPWAEAGQTKQPGYSEGSRDSSRKEHINHGDMMSPAPASNSAVSGMSLVTYRSMENLKSTTSWKIQSLSSNFYLPVHLQGDMGPGEPLSQQLAMFCLQILEEGQGLVYLSPTKLLPPLCESS